jgi:hypothetical protein
MTEFLIALAATARERKSFVRSELREKKQRDMPTPPLRWAEYVDDNTVSTHSGRLS